MYRLPLIVGSIKLSSPVAIEAVVRATTSVIEKLRLVPATETSSTLLTLAGGFFRIEAADMKIELRNATSLMAVGLGARFEPATHGFICGAELVYEAVDEFWICLPDRRRDWQTRLQEAGSNVSVYI